jgi:hypothetical protein
VPAPPRFDRAFVADHRILQREQKVAAPAVTVLAYAVVIAIALSLLGLLAWGLHRLAATGDVRGRPAPARPAPRRGGSGNLDERRGHGAPGVREPDAARIGRARASDREARGKPW